MLLLLLSLLLCSFAHHHYYSQRLWEPVRYSASDCYRQIPQRSRETVGVILL